jgi:hypothetical protein
MRWQASFLTLLLLWFTASSIGAQTTWRKHVYKPDGFETEFSGEVLVRPSQISEEARAKLVRSTNYIQDGSDFKYMVTATLTKSGVIFDKGVEASFGWHKCQTPLGQTALNLPKGLLKGIGRELRGGDCADGFQVEARYYAVGNWFYQVIAQYKAGSGELAARHFLQSFKLIGQ